MDGFEQLQFSTRQRTALAAEDWSELVDTEQNGLLVLFAVPSTLRYSFLLAFLSERRVFGGSIARGISTDTDTKNSFLFKHQLLGTLSWGRPWVELECKGRFGWGRQAGERLNGWFRRCESAMRWRLWWCAV